MKKKVLALLTILFFVILTIPTFAQSAEPGDQQNRPGPGYGSSAGPGGGYGYGPGYGMGPGMMGPGYGPGYGWGPGMMGPGYGYGPSEGPTLTPEEREARAKAFVEEYVRRYLPGYTLEKKPTTKKK